MKRVLHTNLVCLFTLVACFPAENAGAQDETELTAEVTQSDLKIEVELTGVFVADDKDEIAIEPSKYRGDLIVTKILDEGVEVKKGDVLMEFEPNKLDEALEEAENEVTDANVELQKATAELESAKIDAKSKLSQLQTELEFLQTEVEAATQKQELEVAEKEKGITDAESSLADSEVDFQQLKELYEERDRPTATEDILVSREEKKIADQKLSIEKLKREYKFYLDFEKDKTKKEKQLEIAKKTSEIEKEAITLEAAVAEKQSVVDKAQRKLDTAQKKVEGLKADREQLRVVSPRDGVLFYKTTGEDENMAFMFGGGEQDELEVGGRVSTHSILLTVATMENLSVKMQVKEDDIQHMKAELPITVRPDAFPSLSLEGKLTKVDQIASRTDMFSNLRRFTVRGKCSDEKGNLKSGMNCQIVVHADKVPDAIQVPIVAVVEEGGKYFCNVKQGNKVEKREVQIGLSNSESVQIKEGLKAGETVYLSDPGQN